MAPPRAGGRPAGYLNRGPEAGPAPNAVPPGAFVRERSPERGPAKLAGAGRWARSYGRRGRAACTQLRPANRGEAPLCPAPSPPRPALSSPPTPGDASRCRLGAALGGRPGARGARSARRGGAGRLLPVRRGARRRCHPQAGRRRLWAAAALRALPVLRRRALRTLREYPRPRAPGRALRPAAPTPAAASNLAPRRPGVE